MTGRRTQAADIPQHARNFVGGRARGLLVGAGILVLLVTGCATPARQADAVPLTEEQRTANVASFDYVWTTVREKHWDPEMGGIDWDAVRSELRPGVENAQTMAETREVLHEMIDRLGESHYGIIPAEVYPAVSEADPASGEGDSGISVSILDAAAVVTRIDPNSDAARQGVRPGWIIVEVEGRDTAAMIDKIREAVGDRTIFRLLAARRVLAGLHGGIGETRRLAILDGEGQRRELSVELGAPAGWEAKFGNMPPIRVTFESRVLDERIGYIAIGAFFDPPRLMQDVDAAMDQFVDADGMVIDLRGNPGGIGALAMGLAGYFIPEQGRWLGTMHTRGNDLKFVVNARPAPFAGPVAILVDEGTGSTSEIFAGGMQDLGRARLFGTLTAGAVLPSIFERLPNGDGFQYAFADYVSASGRRLEGQGVEPDETVHLTPGILLEDPDPVLSAAVQWIRAQQGAGDGMLAVPASVNQGNRASF